MKIRITEERIVEADSWEQAELLFEAGQGETQHRTMVPAEQEEQQWDAEPSYRFPSAVDPEGWKVGIYSNHSWLTTLEFRYRWQARLFHRLIMTTNTHQATQEQRA